MRSALFTLALALTFAGSAMAEPTLLECRGGGQRDTTATVTTNNWSSPGTPTQSTVQASEAYSDRMMVEFDEAGGRVRFPRSLLPQIRGQGSGDGWWILEDYSLTDDEIRGRVNLNWLNRPTITIDRRTGNVDMASRYATFAGECAPVAVNERLF